jgi:hypothetical protein
MLRRAGGGIYACGSSGSFLTQASQVAGSDWNGEEVIQRPAIPGMRTNRRFAAALKAMQDRGWKLPRRWACDDNTERRGYDAASLKLQH